LTQKHLFERAWFAITETGLALTIFRDEFTLIFAFLFGALLFIKVFHWLASDRIDFVSFFAILFDRWNNPLTLTLGFMSKCLLLYAYYYWQMLLSFGQVGMP
jgi:hypothetical protein